jgi:hypothetical protein
MAPTVAHIVLQTIKGVRALDIVERDHRQAGGPIDFDLSDSSLLLGRHRLVVDRGSSQKAQERIVLEGVDKREG